MLRGHKVVDQKNDGGKDHDAPAHNDDGVRYHLHHEHNAVYFDLHRLSRAGRFEDVKRVKDLLYKQRYYAKRVFHCCFRVLTTRSFKFTYFWVHNRLMSRTLIIVIFLSEMASSLM